MEYELQVSKEMIQPLYVEIGYMNPDRMAHIMQQLVEIGLVSKPVSLHEFLYQAPSEQWIFWRPWFLLSLAACVLILLLALYLLMCNQRLNREIALRRQREEEIWQLARRDPLTGLPNRLSLMERLDAQIKCPAPGCLLFCDLDDFKQVNDNFGHSHGDALLCQLAERISRSLGPQHFFARLAGDEFVLLLPGHDQAQADAIAEQIRAVMQSPFEVEGVPLTVGISVGISQYQPGWRAEQWLIQADRAMYHDKGSPLAAPPG